MAWSSLHAGRENVKNGHTPWDWCSERWLVLRANTVSLDSPNEKCVSIAVKLLRYATDPSACEGERSNALGRLAVVIERGAVTFDQLAQAIGGGGHPHRRRRRQREHHGPAAGESPAACSVVMPWGKWEGTTLRSIAENDHGYLVWLVETVTGKRHRHLVECVRVVLDWFTRRGGRT
jgi:hypothetical protein